MRIYVRRLSSLLEDLHMNSPTKSDFHIGEIFEVTQQYLEFDRRLFLSVLLKNLRKIILSKIGKISML